MVIGGKDTKSQVIYAKNLTFFLYNELKFVGLSYHGSRSIISSLRLPRCDSPTNHKTIIHYRKASYKAAKRECLLRFLGLIYEVRKKSNKLFINIILDFLHKSKVFIDMKIYTNPKHSRQ